MQGKRFPHDTPTTPLWRRVCVLIVFLIAVVAVRFVDVQPFYQRILSDPASRGVPGMLLYILLYISASLFFFPSMFLTMGAGAVWGVALGTPLALLSSTSGAAVAFLFGRYVARDWVRRQIVQYPAFLRIDEAMADHGWKIVGLTRLSPAFPYAFLNYGYGLTSIRLGPYLFATALFMFPGALLYTNIGAMAGNAVRGTHSTPELVLLGGGILATVVVTVIISRIADGSLAQTLSAKERERMNA